MEKVMPPKTKITKEMLHDAAIEITRESGVENVNARTIAKRLNCSTQPVMYIFKRIEDLKRALYDKADWYHSDYLMLIDNPEEMMLGIGLNYIRFAIYEPNLFRFLFQSGYAKEHNLLKMVESEELAPILSAMQGAMQMSMEKVKKAFVSIAVFAHGYASIIANNALEYDEQVVISHLDRAYRGAVLAVTEENE